jgi:hypothetical protein
MTCHIFCVVCFYWRLYPESSVGHGSYFVQVVFEVRVSGSYREYLRCAAWQHDDIVAEHEAKSLSRHEKALSTMAS